MENGKIILDIWDGFMIVKPNSPYLTFNQMKIMSKGKLEFDGQLTIKDESEYLFIKYRILVAN